MLLLPWEQPAWPARRAQGIEQGTVVLDEAAGQWVYAAQVPVVANQTVVIHVTATDRPGNMASKTVHHALISASYEIFRRDSCGTERRFAIGFPVFGANLFPNLFTAASGARLYWLIRGN
jgi:hypothetical protein